MKFSQDDIFKYIDDVFPAAFQFVHLWGAKQ